MTEDYRKGLKDIEKREPVISALPNLLFPRQFIGQCKGKG